jgi:hypothetical protein
MDAKRFNIPRNFASALWCVGIGLLINALVFVWPHANADTTPGIITPPSDRASDDSSGPSITLVSTQLSSSNWGFVLLDYRRHTLAVYEILPDVSRLKLLAARDFQNDLNLQDFNNSSPTPAEVKSMLNAGGGGTAP